MRLNGWQRMGLVLSVLWALGAAIYERNEQVKSADALYQLKAQACFTGQADTTKECLNKVSLQDAMDATANWADVAFYAFGPVIAGWIVTLIAISTFRWISAGFPKKNI